MSAEKESALKQIDNALLRFNMVQHYSGLEQERIETESYFLLKSALKRLAPAGSVYAAELEDEYIAFHRLAAIVTALRAEYDGGYLQTIKELIHGETFSDMADQASHLLGEGFKDAAAVIAGGVLEQHLRSLCTKHGIMPIPDSLNKLNDALYKANLYNGTTMKSVTLWAGIRNDAAHGHYAKVDAKQVELMIAGIRHFLMVHPA